MAQRRDPAVAEKALVKSPEVNLNDIQCGKRFCRATFRPEQRNKEAVTELFGKPPFMEKGFTVEDTDGKVALYFVRPDEAQEQRFTEVNKEPAH